MKYSALLGNPVEHSTSPFLFEILSKELGIEYAHLKINVPSKEKLKETINSITELGFVGFNITIPYKLDMYNLVDECDEKTEKIRSINSVAIKNKRLVATNTDGKAAISSIQHFHNISQKDRIVILGAGGVAYPIVYEISQITKNVVVFNEDLDAAKEMLYTLGLENFNFYALDDYNNFVNELNQATLIINATSVGMIPNESSLIPEEMIKQFSDKKLFFDVVFNPSETKMLKYAKKYNHKIVNGVYMLVYQAIYVMSFWLEKEIKFDKRKVEKIVLQMVEYLEVHDND